MKKLVMMSPVPSRLSRGTGRDGTGRDGFFQRTTGLQPPWRKVMGYAEGDGGEGMREGGESEGMREGGGSEGMREGGGSEGMRDK